MAINLKLNGTDIKAPTHFQPSKFKLTRETGRLINGLMVMDYVALKKKFNLEYVTINGNDMNTILDILDTSTIFFTFQYTDNRGTHTHTVYAGAISQDLYRTDGSHTWKDVSFALIER